MYACYFILFMSTRRQLITNIFKRMVSSNPIATMYQKFVLSQASSHTSLKSFVSKLKAMIDDAINKASCLSTDALTTSISFLGVDDSADKVGQVCVNVCIPSTQIV